MVALTNDATTKSGRQRCRLCGSLAGLTRNLCNGCRMAEVRRHIKRAPKPSAQDVQAAYSASLATLPQVEVDAAGAVAQGITTGLQAALETGSTAADAASFAATLAAVPQDKSTAQVFFSYSRRAFYIHVRQLLKELDTRRKTPGQKYGRRLRTRSTPKGKSLYAMTELNEALARALRWSRIYLQEEMIPMALKMNCSKTQIWHLETGNNVVQDKWVQAYATALGLERDRLWAYADALCEGPAAKGCPRDQLLKFVDVVLRP